MKGWKIGGIVSFSIITLVYGAILYDLSLKQSMSSVFELLKYIAVWPAGGKLADSKGNILPDCFLIPKGSTALDFAYHIHSDLGNNFIKAIDIRTKKAIGKEHQLKHRDGIEIITK